MKRKFLKPTLISFGLFFLIWISWPKYQLFECRSTQSEAKAWLQHLYEAEKFYFSQHHNYASLKTLLEEGLVNSREIHYRYYTELTDEKHFKIIAERIQGVKDIWMIDQSGEIHSIENACTP